MLRKALKTRYPERDLDPDQTMIGTPQWQTLDGALVALPTRFESLTQMLMHQCFTSTRANYLEGEHFLATYLNALVVSGTDRLRVEAHQRLDAVLPTRSSTLKQPSGRTEKPPASANLPHTAQSLQR
jgi:hypothetical protein